MTYLVPPLEESLDPGDILDGCPIPQVEHFDLFDATKLVANCGLCRVIVLTQTCDLANQKTTRVMVALMHDAERLVRDGIVKAADVRGPIRAARVFGWYYLPRHGASGLPESVVDLRQVHTLPRGILEALREHGARRARVGPLFREHLARHFADTYSRIGLPEPYETEP